MHLACGKVSGQSQALWDPRSAVPSQLVGTGVGYSVRHNRHPFHKYIQLIPVPDLNLPLSAIAILLVFFFLTLRTPQESLREKLARMDWM